MYDCDDSEDGITLRDMMPLEDVETTIDWDAVMGDFAWIHGLSTEYDKCARNLPSTIVQEKAKKTFMPPHLE